MRCTNRVPTHMAQKSKAPATSKVASNFSLSAFLDYFIPGELQVQPDAHRRARMFMMSHAFGPFLGIVIPLYLHFFLNIATDYRFWTFLASILAFWVYPFALRITKRYQTIAFISVQNLIFCILWACYAYGGIFSPFLSWALIIPMLSFFYLPAAGLIRNIGDWVLRTACTEAAKWPEHVKLAVNLSTVQVEAEGLVASVVSALGYSGLAPSRLEFEVTESVFLREGKSTGRTLDALRSLGVSLALDDFGTGYSSLGYLQRTEFSKIKIDRSFVRSAAEGNEDSLAIIKAIVSMARGLGMVTTAEGVETEAERKLVCELGCSQIQGFLIGRPERRGSPDCQIEDGPVAEGIDDGPAVMPVPRRRNNRAA